MYYKSRTSIDNKKFFYEFSSNFIFLAFTVWLFQFWEVRSTNLWEKSPPPLNRLIKGGGGLLCPIYF